MPQAHAAGPQPAPGISGHHRGRSHMLTPSSYGHPSQHPQGYLPLNRAPCHISVPCENPSVECQLSLHGAISWCS